MTKTLELWQMTSKELFENLLFHGTSEQIVGELKGGPYDKILWTALNPAVAQNYIPASGIISYYRMPSSYQLEERVKPEYLYQNLVEQMGYFPDIEEKNGRLYSWGWKDGRVPLVKDVVSYIKNDLGYGEPDDSLYELKTMFQDGKQVILPADFKKKGQLYIISGKENLKIFEYAAGDLTNPAYNHFNVFSIVEKEGYDAIKINDFAQSKKYGNVGHESIGLFPSGIKKVTMTPIPAVNFDWEYDVTFKHTPEFSRWHKELVVQALSQGKEVPLKVLQEYELNN